MREFEIVIVIMVMVIRMKDTCECCLATERNGLLQINSSIRLKYLPPWGSDGDDCCNWEGIECDNTTRHVTRLYLRRVSGLGEWYLNASLFLPFKQLNELSLPFNNISGCIHNEGFERLWSITNLEILELSDNNFNNSILQSLSGFPSLKSLLLDYNSLGGMINISELNNLTTTLQELDLSRNEIQGFETMRGGEETPIFNSLEILHLSGNDFNDQTTINVFQIIGRISSLKSLFLDSSGLSGKIPASQGLCNLKHLEVFDMSSNNLNGNLPWCLSNLTSLRSLYLSNNQFTGSISLMQGLTSLVMLFINDNHFRIPMSLSPLFNLSLLTGLNVVENIVYIDTKDLSLNPKFQLMFLFMGGYGTEGEALPEFLYHQSNLEEMTISNIKLTGGFPYWLLENNTRLHELVLTNTFLSGNLLLPTHPHVYLRFLDISDNFFHGYIPSQIGVYFPSIWSLDMSRNELNGSLPSSLCNIASSLARLDISHNNISGTIPQCIKNMSNLSVLDLSSNNVSGSLPSNFSAPLDVINLSKNRLQGSLKDAFNSCIDIFLLDLSHNRFSGSIPPEFGKLTQLSFLVLGKNNLEGEIPIELCKLQLSLLDLSHNKFFGHMLHCFNITSSWSRNQQIFASEPLEIIVKGQTYLYHAEILKYMTGIDMSCNNLTGKIPFEIRDLRNIKALNLSYNCLTGPIPPTFSSLKEIESLDLSHNNLQGTIPHQLTQLTSLEIFNVSYNNLSGRTPDQVAQFATFGETSYKGNPFLCGWPLSKSCGTPDSSPQSNATSSLQDDKSHSEFIDMEFFYVSFGVAYTVVLLTLVIILCINPYWRRVWFYYVQMSMDKTYYFIIDNVIPHFSRS